MGLYRQRIPFALCLGLVLGAERIGLTMTAAIMLSLWIIALWWLLLSLPLLRSVPAEVFCGTTAPRGGREFPPLGAHPGECETGKEYFFVFVGILFYIDGVYTIIDMATAYGTALGFDTAGLLLALLVLQVVAFPCSIFLAVWR